ncbi:hypothetical protein MMC19_006547 [Ptychographa xylographoides]|nr:hypothetical protein [Ptychographa xylographoides]
MSITSINRVDRSDPTTNPTLSTELAASDTVRITLHFQQASSTLPDFAGEVVLDPYDDMGLAYNVYLNADRIFGCKSCKTHLATHDSIISRNFRGQHGKAYLFASVVNIQQGEATERNMTTGRHVVRDISCRQCKETVGWKYDKAYESSEKYKEGKYILEAELLCAVY